MRIVISGMSGFVGTALKNHFTALGHKVEGIRIRSETTLEELAYQLENANVLINLSGTNILAPWTDAYKKSLVSSRVETTEKLVDGMKMCQHPPTVMLSASAVGIYDTVHEHTEESGIYADDFLSNLCQQWEATAMEAKTLGLRVAVMRFGVIYGKGGGAMEKMLPPFKMCVGGKLGSGEQMISWIHIDDLVRAVDFLITDEALKGVFNFTAPEALTNAQQTKELASQLHRPSFLGVPAFMVKLIFGDGATVVLDSKHAVPKALLDAGFSFNYPTFEAALRQILSDPAD